MLNVAKETVEDAVKRVYNERSTVEANLNLSAERFDTITSVSGFVAGTQTTVESGIVKCAGKVFFNVTFTGEDEERIETGVKFEFKKTVDVDVVDAYCRYALEDFSVKNDGGMLFVTCELLREVSVFTKRETSFVANVDALSDKKDATFLTTRFNRGEADVEDGFETVKIKKVLASEAKAVVLSCKSAKNLVTVTGTVVVSFVLLPFSENSDILKEVRAIPFKFEFDAQGVKQEDVSTAIVSVNELSVKVVTDEEDNKSTVDSLVKLDFCITSFGMDDRTFVVDAISRDCGLGFQKAELTYQKPLGQKTVTERVSGKAVVNVPEYSRLIKAVCERAVVDEIKCDNGEAVISGIIQADCLFFGDNGVVSEKSQLPFSVTVDYSGDFIDNVFVCVENLQGRLRSGKLEQDATLYVGFCENVTVRQTLVCDVSEGEQTTASVTPISIYIAKNGDTEWDVVKALGESIDDIKTYNDDLNFPLSGEERIIVFRKN